MPVWEHSESLGPYHPSRPEESLPPLPENILDTADNHPSDLQMLLSAENNNQASDLIPPLIFGCSVFGYGIYSTNRDVIGAQAFCTVKYALKAGFRAFDTAPWYHPSELVMGRVLSALTKEYPRESYMLISKVGKYGPKRTHHRYDRITTRASVERSLRRLGTEYLDVVYLHDVEYRCSHPYPSPAGYHAQALKALRNASVSDSFFLRGPYEALGDGDKEIMEGLQTLRELQCEGKIHKIGIAGYPLPVLLRLSLVAARTPSIGPLDAVQTYAHHTLANDALAEYMEQFAYAGVGQVVNAAPLAMGMLTVSGPPDWHPVRSAPTNILQGVDCGIEMCQENGTEIAKVAMSYGLSPLLQHDGKRVPVVIGCKNIHEINQLVESWRKVVTGDDVLERRTGQKVLHDWEARGVRGWSWASPAGSAA